MEGTFHCRDNGIEVTTGIRDGDLWIYSIDVEPALRGQGRGELVIKNILAYARDLGMKVCLSVGEDEDGFQHDRLVDWYRRLGFVEMDPMPVDEFQMTISP